MGKFQRLNKGRITLDFFPESGGEVESVSIVGDRELSGGSGGAPKETNFSLSVGSDAVPEAGERDVSEDF